MKNIKRLFVAMLMCSGVGVSLAWAGLVPCNSFGLEALWTLDEGSGTTALDCSVNARNGTITGATYAPGIDGSALSFDGSDDFVDFGDLRPVASSMTIEAWVKPAALVSGSAMILGKRYYRPEDGSSDASYRLMLYDNQPCFGFANGANIIFCGANAIPTHEWTYLAGTYDASTGVAKLYVNCDLVKQVNGIGTGNIQYDAHKALMGALSGPSDAGHFTHFNGRIDEVGIFNYALTAAELRSHFELAPGCGCPR